MGKYIGRDNPYGLFEKQSLSPNGSETQFPLEYKVGDTTSILVVSNGAVLQPEVDYALDNAGTAITFKEDPPVGSLYVLYLGRELATSNTGFGSASLTDLDDVSVVAPQENQILKYNGSGWVNVTPSFFTGNYQDLTNKPDILGIEANLQVLDARLDILESGSTTSVFETDISVNGIVVGKGNNSLLGNTALGTFALANTTGNPTTRFGPGDDNTAIGSYALVANTTGQMNVAVGAGGTLGNNTTGTGNTAVGTAALAFSSTGRYNTAIGTNSGLAMNTGSFNVIIGGNPGYSIANSNNNIIISDGDGNIRIKADSIGRVGINTESPLAQLHVMTKTSEVCGLVLQGAAFQSSNLLEIRNNSSNLMFSVSAFGNTTILPTDTISPGLSIQLLETQISPALRVLKQTPLGTYSSIFSVTADGVIESPTITSIDHRLDDLENQPAPVTSLAALTDVVLTTPTQNQILKYNGSNWVNGTAPSTFSGSYADLTDKPTIPDLPISLENGGTGQTSAQAAINALTQVSSAPAEYVLTKDTTSGNATWKSLVYSALGVPDGSVASPALYFTSDSNTGIYRAGEDIIGFVANGHPGLAVSGVSGVGRLAVGDANYISNNIQSRLQLIDDNNDPTSGITLGRNESTVVRIYKSASYALTVSGSMQINNTSSSLKGLVVKGAASQSEPLLDVQNNSGTTLTSISADGSLSTKRYLENISSNFTDTLAPVSSTLTIDTLVGNTILGALNASVTTWAFINVPVENGKSVAVSVIISGSLSYTYGDACSVNGTSVSGGIKWVGGGAAPVATSGTDIISFIIVKDQSGTIKVFGSASTNFV